MGEIAEPGVYEIPMIEYLRDPVTDGSISASGVGEILKAPARFRAWADEPIDPVERGRSAAMDFGTVAHAIVTGTDADTIERVTGVDDWRTKRAQDERKAIEWVGRVAVLDKTYARARELAQAVWAHPIAGPLFESGRGEQTLVWLDDEFGVWCRARLDVLPDVVDGRRMIIPDLKTTENADPAACDASIARYGYGRQGAHYRAGVIALGLDDDPAVVDVFVETRRPYLITVRQLGELSHNGDRGPLAIGRRQVRAGLRIFADCQAADDWPGYGETIEFADTPSWAVWEDRGRDY